MKITKKLNKTLKKNTRVFSIVAAAAVILVGSVILTNYLKGSHAASSTLLSLSPTTQTSTVGDTVVVTITLNPSGTSINTVQSVFNYSAANYTLVSAVAGASFGTFVDTPTAGSVSFTAGSISPVTTTVTVATITLQATSAGSSALSLAAVCGSGDFSSDCSAAYDSTTNANDLGAVAGANFVVNPIVPAAPVLSITGSTSTSISLSWTVPADANGTTNGPGIAGYKIYRNSSSTALATVTSGTTYTDSSLTPNTTYSYTIVAYDKGTPVQTSVNSNSVQTTTAQVAPGAPTGITKSTSTFNSVSLSWTASTDSSGTVAGYDVYVNGSTTAAGTSTGTSYTVTGLAANTSYSFTIKAYDTSQLLSPASSPLAASTNKLGDLDGDGQITGHDISILIANYGSNYAPAEFDGTAYVEAHDLSILISNYGK
jgi:chitodextrinase